MTASAARRPTLRRVLVAAMGGVAVGAVALTALVTVGLARLQAPQRTVDELGREAIRLAEVAEELPCAGRQPPQLAREFGPRVRFVPDDARRARFAPGTRDRGRTVRSGIETYYASAPAMVCGRTGTLYVFRAVRETPVLPEGFATRLAAAAVAGLCAAAAVAYAIARRLSRPLGDLSRTARTVAHGQARTVGEPQPADPAEIAELREAFDGMLGDLAEAREAQESFLLSVSHELRTPLTAIRGYGEALADGTATDPARAGGVVALESRRLERLVQDLLDLARLRTDAFSVAPQAVDLADVAGSVVAAMEPLARETGVRLAVVERATPTVTTDPDRVHQVVSNLVENALRVTPAAEAVTVEVLDEGIDVVDRGPGIAPEDLEHAFDRFYLWRKYRGERPVGSGLGLAVVAELAQRLGIAVTVTSTPDEGSRFSVRFDA